MQCGGVSLLSPGSVSTDVDEAMRPGGFSDFSRSSAGDAVPSGDNSALQVLQGRHFKLGSMARPRGAGDNSLGVSGGRAAKRQRNTVSEKVWEWLQDGTIVGRSSNKSLQHPQPQSHHTQPQARKIGDVSTSFETCGQESVCDSGLPSEQSIQGPSHAESSVPPSAAMALDALDATHHTSQPSGRLKRKTVQGDTIDPSAAPDSRATSECMAFKSSEPEPTLECTLDCFNLQVSRLSGDTLAEHNASLLSRSAPISSSQLASGGPFQGLKTLRKPRKSLIARRTYGGCSAPAPSNGQDFANVISSVGFGGIPLPLPMLTSPASAPAVKPPATPPPAFRFASGSLQQNSMPAKVFIETAHSMTAPADLESDDLNK